jgi:hypothetical protein
MKHDWIDGTKKRWSRLFVYAIVILFLPRSLNILFRNLYFMNLILMTKYTLSTEFVPAQVRGNNHWRTSQVRLKILNYRTLFLPQVIQIYTEFANFTGLYFLHFTTFSNQSLHFYSF